MTPEKSELFEKLHELVTRHVDNTISDHELRELEELVIGNEMARHLYIDYMQELFHITSRLNLPVIDSAQIREPPSLSGNSKPLIALDKAYSYGQSSGWYVHNGWQS